MWTQHLNHKKESNLMHPVESSWLFLFTSSNYRIFCWSLFLMMIFWLQSWWSPMHSSSSSALCKSSSRRSWPSWKPGKPVSSKQRRPNSSQAKLLESMMTWISRYLVWELFQFVCSEILTPMNPPVDAAGRASWCCRVIGLLWGTC